MSDQRDMKPEAEKHGAARPGRVIPEVLEELPTPLRPFFASIRKVPFGVAIGATFSILFAYLAAFNAIFPPETTKLAILMGENFFPGYGPSATGALLGVLWGFAFGFLVGWFTAFGRNLVITIWIFFVGTRQRLSEGARAFDDM